VCQCVRRVLNARVCLCMWVGTIFVSLHSLHSLPPLPILSAVGSPSDPCDRVSVLCLLLPLIGCLDLRVGVLNVIRVGVGCVV